MRTLTPPPHAEKAASAAARHVRRFDDRMSRIAAAVRALKGRRPGETA